MAGEDLVAPEDPDGFMLVSHVVPLASDKLDYAAAALIDKVSAAMSRG
jgi:osmoprotectant transport system substrate-binding protein